MRPACTQQLPGIGLVRGIGRGWKDALKHHTGNRTTTLRSDVPDCDVDGVVPLVQSALDCSMVSFPATGFSLEIDPDGMVLRKAMRCTTRKSTPCTQR